MTQQIENSRAESPYEVLFIGLDATDRDFLYDRINRRVSVMLENGLEAEARDYLAQKNTSTSSQAIGCKELRPYFDGDITLQAAADNLRQATRRYAKRQLTWFRRNKNINWFMLDSFKEREDLYKAVFDKITDWERSIMV